MLIESEMKNGSRIDKSFINIILSAFVITSAFLTCLKLKLMLTESSVASTECQMPAGWYRMSPASSKTSVYWSRSGRYC